MIMFISKMSSLHISYHFYLVLCISLTCPFYGPSFLGVIFNNVNELGWITQTHQERVIPLQTFSQTATILDQFGQSMGGVVYTKLYMIYIYCLLVQVNIRQY